MYPVASFDGPVSPPTRREKLSSATDLPVLKPLVCVAPSLWECPVREHRELPAYLAALPDEVPPLRRITTETVAAPQVVARGGAK